MEELKKLTTNNSDIMEELKKLTTNNSDIIHCTCCYTITNVIDRVHKQKMSAMFLIS